MASLATLPATAVGATSRPSFRPALSVRAASQDSKQMHEEKPNFELRSFKSYLQHSLSMQSFGRAALTAAVAAALMFADPALAFKLSACHHVLVVTISQRALEFCSLFWGLGGCGTICMYSFKFWGAKCCRNVQHMSSFLFMNPFSIHEKGGGPYGQEVTRGLDLSGRDFSGKTLIKQDFKASNLRQTIFKGAKLLGASFFDANLTGSDLTDADLRGADLSLTNAAKANFTNANLEGALVTGNTSFKGAIITGADFTDVLFRDDQRSYLCSIADGVNSVTGNATRDTLGC